MSNQFVGFADSDKFIEAVDRSKPVNLSVSRKHGKPDKRFGMSIDSTVLTMSQVNGSEVLYFEHATHKFQTIHGEYLGQDSNKIYKLAEQVREAAEKYLDKNGIRWREALVSMPLSYVKLDGLPTFLRYDNESECYLYIDAGEEVASA